MVKNRQKSTSMIDDLYHDKEIDLMDIIDILIRRKWIIVIFTILTVAVATLYCVFAPRVYRAGIVFRLPSDLAIAPLVVNLPGIKSNGKEQSEIYAMFDANLQSSEVRRFVWEGVTENVGINNLSFIAFNQSFKYQSLKVSRNNFLKSIYFEGQNPQHVSEILNLLIKKANSLAVEQFIDTKINFLTYIRSAVPAEIEQRKRDIRVEIDFLRKSYEKKRLARIMKLEDNLRITQKVEMMTSDNITEHEGFTNVPIAISYDNLPLYMLGKRLLKAELAGLRKRKSNDPYIDGLCKLQAEIDLLENNSYGKHGIELQQLSNPFLVKIRMIDEEIGKLNKVKERLDIVRAASVELPVNVPLIPIRPQVNKIVVFSLIIGLVLSVLFVFLSNFFIIYRQRKSVLEEQG
ncbi:MAG: Wzz/FepE/Etk N-terminal domain-containing protein [Desulfobulbaceae bacterium]|nr:Wzz/FepE/Etk N-terminal domain-containing protein [Desulfobulbaceae bacterium]